LHRHDLPVGIRFGLIPDRADADLAALVVALPAAQERGDLAGFDVSAVAVDQPPHVQRFRVLALRAVRAQRVVGMGEEVAEGADDDGRLRRHAPRAFSEPRCR
jgi:hypothetical protein